MTVEWQTRAPWLAGGRPAVLGITATWILSRMEELEILGRMGVALGIGVLIGLERGWSTRDLPDGRRVAGVRTFGLLALVGAVMALLSEALGDAVLGLGFLAVVAVLMFGRYLKLAETRDIGVTTIVAGLLTFTLGAAAMLDHLGLAVSAGVLTALLLSVKAELHSAIRHIDRQELLAALKLLIMSVVLLPVLPNRGFGPWQALNPFEVWTMVVLICSLSFVGYVGVKLLGERQGITLAALAGALVSSTAVTITLSRLPDRDRGRVRLVGGAIVLASAIMYARTLVVVAVFGLPLLAGLAVPLGLAAVIGLLVAVAFIRSAGTDQPDHGLSLRNPFEFWMAVKFGLVLAVVIVLAQALKEWAGDTGVFLVAGASGFVDVDAATLSLARMAPDQIPIEVGVGAVLLASVTNTLFKASIAVYNSKAALLAPIVIGVGAQLAAIAVGALIIWGTITGSG